MRKLVITQTRYNFRPTFYKKTYQKILPSHQEGLETILLDCGTGDGSVIKSILSYATTKKDYYCVILSDVDPTAFQKRTNEDLDRLRYHKVVFDAHYPSIREETIDILFALNLIEHLRMPEKFLSRARNLLKPGSYGIVLQYPNIFSLVEVHTKLPLLLVPFSLRQKLADSILQYYLNCNIRRDAVESFFNSKRWFTFTFPMIHPVEVFDQPFRILYSIILKSGIFSVHPVNYITIAKRAR